MGVKSVSMSTAVEIKEKLGGEKKGKANITRVLKKDLRSTQAAQNNEREFDEEKLGRGHISELQEDNFEFGAWNPVSSSSDKGVGAATVELLSSLFSGEQTPAERKSDVDYFPLTDAITVVKSQDEAEDRADSNRLARDSES